MSSPPLKVILTHRVVAVQVVCEVDGGLGMLEPVGEGLVNGAEGSAGKKRSRTGKHFFKNPGGGNIFPVAVNLGIHKRSHD